MPENQDFTQYDDLEQLPDEELEKIIIEGTNIQIHTSKAAVAKRVLENRRQRKQLEAAIALETAAKQLKESHKELLTVVSGLGEVAKLFNFLKSHWLPERSIVIRIIVFLMGTVVAGIAVNLISDYIAKYLLGW